VTSTTTPIERSARRVGPGSGSEKYVWPWVETQRMAPSGRTIRYSKSNDPSLSGDCAAENRSRVASRSSGWKEASSGWLASPSVPRIRCSSGDQYMPPCSRS
jgi:hypothetical protein